MSASDDCAVTIHNLHGRPIAAGYRLGMAFELDRLAAIGDGRFGPVRARRAVAAQLPIQAEARRMAAQG
jgi:hypothetical protein